jgi:hypothetical protein
MAAVRWILGGVLGGAAGVLIWVLVGYFTHYEVGWIAWGVGFLAGLGVRYAAYLSGGEASFAKGAVAALIACGSIVLAKFLVFTLMVGGIDSDELRRAANDIHIDDEAMIVSKAHEIADGMFKQGKAVAWPAGVSLDTATKKRDYPAGIWTQAEARWKQLPPEKQREEMRLRAQVAFALLDLSDKAQFANSFTPWDILWFILAIITAFKVGVGTYGTE